MKGKKIMNTTNEMLIGNAIVGQSGGPTAAINATLAGVIRGALENPAIGTLYGARNGVEGMLQENLLNLTEIFAGQEGEAKLKTLENTPAAALGSCRKKLAKIEDDPSQYDQLFALFAKYEIHYFFYIGGNDSMDTVAKLSRAAEARNYPLRVMGVPKTIDNDVAGTDHTPGYGSAAKYIAASMQEILRDCAVYTVKAVTIVEIMGRDAGWLTAAAALPAVNGCAPDLIYLPERPFDYDRFFADVEQALNDHPNVVIAVSEGLRTADGTYVGEGAQSGATDVFGHKYLSGTGKALEIAVKEKLGCKVRSVELNILQRCASHIASATDLSESVRVGRAAVEAAASGITGRMMNFRRLPGPDYAVEIGSEDVQKIANAVRCVPDEFINAAGNNITEAGIAHILPLIQGEPEIVCKNGLPVHFIFD